MIGSVAAAMGRRPAGGSAPHGGEQAPGKQNLIDDAAY
jgi:hypothetical protein